MSRVKAIILGAGYRGRAYAQYARAYPDALEIVGVADPVHADSIVAPQYWSDWRDSLSSRPSADIAVVTLPDSMHEEAALEALEAGYHLLLEKPLSTTEDGCKRIVKRALELGRLVMPGHILRFAPYFAEIKALIASGEFGEVISISHQESAGFRKIAHSFVRGNWSKAAESSPIILQKCSHDMDLFSWWLEGKRCRKVSSFGSLGLFRSDKMPNGAADRCVNCPCEASCVWSAKKMYLESDELHYLFADDSPEAMRKVIEDTDYGRCVFALDNDVPDHQSVNLEFDGGVTVSHVMTGFTSENVRTTRISLTRGEIIGDGETIVLKPFGGEPRKIVTSVDNSSRHDGGDFNLVSEMLSILARNDPDEIRRTTADSLAGHLICFAAERSRLSGGKVVEL